MIDFKPLENWIGEPLTEKEKTELNKTYEKMMQATKVLKRGNPLNANQFFAMCVVHGYKNLQRMRMTRMVETILEYKVMQTIELNKTIEVTA